MKTIKPVNWIIVGVVVLALIAIVWYSKRPKVEPVESPEIILATSTEQI